MDHFNITQLCVHCVRGKKVFRVDLNLYDAEGKLMIMGTEKMKTFRFMCHFCWKESPLEFYRFCHPDLICHLKRLNEKYNKTKETLDKLNIMFNNIIEEKSQTTATQHVMMMFGVYICTHTPADVGAPRSLFTTFAIT